MAQGLAQVQQDIADLQAVIQQIQQANAPPQPPAPVNAVAPPAGAAQGARPNVRFNTFSNEADEDFLVFRHHIDKVIRLNQYTDEQARLALASAMKGRAAAAVMDIDPLDQNATYPLLMGAYESRFLPAASSQMARMKFDAAKQGQQEIVLDYHARLRSLFNKAYPQATDEVILIRRFSLGLRRKEVRTQVMRGQPKTYAEALELAQNETSVLQMVRVSEVGGGPEPMEIGALNQDSRKVKCFYCQRFGHVKADCRTLKRDLANGKVQGPQGNKGNPGFRGGPATRLNVNEKPGRNQIVASLQALMENLQSEDGEASNDGNEVDSTKEEDF